jgi:dTDP-D-glucose 4,6-dehydratase
MNQNLLVTGGASFIGSNFIRYIQTHETRVHITNLDLLTYAGHLANLKNLPHPDKREFIKGDIRDQELVESLLREKEIDTIVHFAAESHAQLIEYVKDRPGNDWRYAINIQKIQNELGWFPKHDLESGLRKTINWYLKNSNWLKAIQKRQDYQNWISDNYQKRGKA